MMQFIELDGHNFETLNINMTTSKQLQTFLISGLFFTVPDQSNTLHYYYFMCVPINSRPITKVPSDSFKSVKNGYNVPLAD